MLCVQVDLVLGTIQRKADGTLCRSAVDVVDEESLYLLGHLDFRLSLYRQPS